MKKQTILVSILTLILTACGAGVDSSNLTPQSTASTYLTADVSTDLSTNTITTSVTYALNGFCRVGIDCVTASLGNDDYVRVNGVNSQETKGWDGHYSYNNLYQGYVWGGYNDYTISTQYKGENVNFSSTDIFQNDASFYVPSDFELISSEDGVCRFQLKDVRGDYKYNLSDTELDRLNLNVDGVNIKDPYATNDEGYLFDCSLKDSQSSQQTIKITRASKLMSTKYYSYTYPNTVNGMKVMLQYRIKSKPVTIN